MMNMTAVARRLIEEDPSLTADNILERAEELGLKTSRNAFYTAAREWREAKGLGPLPNGAASRPANYGDPSRVPIEATSTPDSSAERVVKQLLSYGGASQGESQQDTLQAIAGLVWEWMDDNGCAELTFRDDGAVHVRERVSTERSFSLVRGGA